jgi:Subtilase family
MTTLSDANIEISLRSRGLDPYAAWGLKTDFKDFVPQRNPRAKRRFRVLIELKAGVTAARLSAEVDRLASQTTILDWAFSIPSIYVDGNFSFVTATVSLSVLDSLSKGDFSSLVVRFCLTTAIADPTTELFPQSQTEEFRPRALSGTVIAVVDTGCPFLHSAFRDSVNDSRVRFLWDQGRAAPAPPSPAPWKPVRRLIGTAGSDAILYAAEISGKQMDQLTGDQSTKRMSEHDVYSQISYATMASDWTHGGAVMGLAAGKPAATGEGLDDEASKLPIIFVQLAQETAADAAGLSMAGYVLDALHYIRSRTVKDTRIALTLSFGRHAGPHDGSSLIERAIDNFVEKCGRNIFISIAAGNTNLAAGHARLEVDKTQAKQLMWEILPGSPTASLLELWFNPADVKIELVPPNHGIDPEPKSIQVAPGELRAHYSGGEIVATAAHAVSTTIRDGSEKSCVLLAVAPTVSVSGARAEALYDNWTVKVSTTSASAVTVDAWIERAEELVGNGWGDRQSRFSVDAFTETRKEYAAGTFVTKFTTLNGIATGEHVHVVGACYADGSLTDYTAAGPELSGLKTRTIDSLHIADESVEQPGISVIMSVGTGVGRMNGTSAAAPRISRGWANVPSDLMLVWPSRTPPELSDQRGRL